MWGCEGFCLGFSWWWIFPIAMMTIMFALCFLMMRGRTGRMMCGPCFGSAGDAFWKGRPESARDILDKRYARGEIGKEEYEKQKQDIERAS